jgi:hypothetical protein
VVRFPEGTGILSLRHCIQTGSEAHKASYRMVTGEYFVGAKRSGREADYLPPSSAEVKNLWRHTSTPPYVLGAWYLFKNGDNFT